MRINKLQKTHRFFLSDAGLETYMIFDKGYELPCFSAAVLLDSDRGRSDLRAYFAHFIRIARESHRGFIMDAPTWRAGKAWAAPLNLTEPEILDINTRAVKFVAAIRDEHESAECPILVNGLVGPAGDAYEVSVALKPNESLHIHSPQIHALGRAGVDMISAMTLTHAGEAIGIVKAAQEIDIPVVVAFTLETDGRLPSGQLLRDAITEVDDATGDGPVYYMINCAHPDHFRDVLPMHADWTRRIGGIRSNASRMSHAELDEADELDDGDPEELACLNAELLNLLPNIRVIGGCCGTDHRHVEAIATYDNVNSEEPHHSVAT